MVVVPVWAPSVNDKLAPYLPGHPLVKNRRRQSHHPRVSAAPFGSASILLISYGYIKMLGGEGCTMSTKAAILNANYLKSRLEGAYDILYVGQSGRVAHEFIIDFRKWKHTIGLEVEDVAKRLMDYSFHAPTVSFPVAGTLMVEPTESESREELDRFCEAMLSIREEIRALEEGKADASDNVLKNAPHTLADVIVSDWTHLPYTREEAVYPVPYLRERKFWTSVNRINNTHGDRNLICVCPPMEVVLVWNQRKELTKCGMRNAELSDCRLPTSWINIPVSFCYFFHPFSILGKTVTFISTSLASCVHVPLWHK